MNKTYRILFYRLNGAQKCPVAYRLNRSIPLRHAKKMLGIEKWTGENMDYIDEDDDVTGRYYPRYCPECGRKLD